MINEYALLLIKQYWEKPKARAEVELKIRTYKKIVDLLKSLPVQLDVDNSIGKQQDLIGRVVGISRVVDGVIPKVFFGFKERDNSLGFADKFNPVRQGAPFYNKFGERYTSQQLSNTQYRQLLKAKIAINNASSLMVSDEHVTMQDAIMQAFNGKAYVVDSQDMTVTLYISPTVPADELRLIMRLDLLPKPQTVRYRLVIHAEPGMTFGFSNNPASRGFADKFNPSRQGGYFARKVF